ncbi:MAG: LysR family transcriptional regulator [Psychromonas sp.]
MVVLVEFSSNLWRSFVLVAEFGSMAKAAKNENVSHSTLSRQLAQLEDELGYLLFERPGQGKGLNITARGKQLLPKVQLAVMTLEKLEQQAMQLFEPLPSCITIAIPDFVPASISAQLCQRLWEKWPQLEIVLMQPSLFEGLRLLMQQRADFAVVISELHALPDFHTDVIGDIQTGLYVSQQHELAKVKDVGFSDIVPYRVLLPMSGKSGLSFVEDTQQSLQHCYIQSTQQTYALCQAGGGVALLPEWMVIKLDKDNPLYELPIHLSRGSLRFKLELLVNKQFAHEVLRKYIWEILSQLMQEADLT